MVYTIANINYTRRAPSSDILEAHTRLNSDPNKELA
jgi:hypothetical protein